MTYRALVAEQTVADTVIFVLASFLFFLIKGLLWLVVIAAAAIWAGS